MQYYLKDLGHGFGTFIKLVDWTEITNNFLLMIGDNYIVFTLGLEEDMITSEHTSNKEDEEYNNWINLKIFSGNIRHGQLSFNPRQSPIIIGRSPDCDVIIEDSMLSRFHCTLEFNESKNQWYIVDGVYDKEKLCIIRKYAYLYIHGHSVGGTNPSLIEALSLTDLNILYDIAHV